MSYLSEVTADAPNIYWRLGEPSGTVAAATIGTGAGTYRNTPTLGVAGALAGDANTAVTFAAASLQDVQSAGSAHVAAQDVGDVFTIEAWIKRASITAAYNFIFHNGSGSIAFRVDITTNLLHLDRAGVAGIVSSTVAITDTTTWHHAVATKNGATVKLYLDGVDVTGAVTNSTFVNPGQAWYIGSGAGSLYWDGSLDEVALYPTALSGARVLVHYNAGLGIFPSGTSAPYRVLARRRH